MFTVYNVGMIYFDGCHVGDKRALVPDGTKGDPTTKPPTPRHYCSIFVGADKVDLDKTHWWWGSKFEREVTFQNDKRQEHTIKVYEFRIKEPSELTFADKRNGKPATFKDLEELPRLDADPQFELDANPKTIARVQLRGGALEARALMGVPVVCWKVDDGDHADPITISARADEGGLYTIVLKDKATMDKQDVPYRHDITMALSNTPDFIALLEAPADPHRDDPAHDSRGHDHTDHNDQHFEHGVIYGQLNKHRRPVKLAGDLRPALKPVKLEQGQPQLGYLQFLAASAQYQNSDCSPSCCPKTGGGGGGT